MKHLVPKLLGFVLLSLLALALLSSCVTSRAMETTFHTWYVQPPPRHEHPADIREAMYWSAKTRARHHGQNKFR